MRRTFFVTYHYTRWTGHKQHKK